jgi:hypothetical protein
MHGTPIYIVLTRAAPSDQYKTNKYSMKLGIFALVAASGATVVPAVSLIVDETEDSFTWVFKRFLDCFRVACCDADGW